MKRVVAALITCVLLAVVLFASRRPSAPPANGPGSSPEDCIQRKLTAAEQGEVSTYLDSLIGSERLRLERELADLSRDAFAQSLRQALQELKGRAVFGLAERERAGQEVVLTVERVYLNRTERQSYRLVRSADQWRIASIQAAQAYQPATAYGTPVFELPGNQRDAAPP